MEIVPQMHPFLFQEDEEVLSLKSLGGLQNILDYKKLMLSNTAKEKHMNVTF